MQPTTKESPTGGEISRTAGLKYGDVLVRSGLTGKEASVYEVLLNSGQIGIGPLLTKVPYKRGDLYNILYSLRDKGLAEQIEIGGKIIFRSADPYRVRDYIEKRQQQMAEASSVLESVLPQMLSVYSLNAEKPSVRYYEGLEGLKKVYAELNNSGERELLLVRSIFDNKNQTVAETVRRQIRKQVGLGIKTRVLIPLDEFSKYAYLNWDRERLVERRIIEPDKLFLPAQILIWGNTVATISMRDKIISTVIENKDIAESQRAMFEFMWQSAGPYHQKIVKMWRDQPGFPDDRPTSGIVQQIPPGVKVRG